MDGETTANVAPYAGGRDDSKYGTALCIRGV